MASKNPLMHVSDEERKKVLSVLEECKRLAEAHYNVTCPPYRVLFDINSPRLGGEAHYDGRLRFNPVFMRTFPDRYFDRTVRHEFAHYFCWKVYGVLRKGTKKKRDIHGEKWREVMRVVGAKDITTTHSYVLPAALKAQIGKPKNKFLWTCKCGEVYRISEPKHRRMLASIAKGGKYKHPPCKTTEHEGVVTFIGPDPTNRVIQHKTTAPQEGSKLYACYEVFKAWWGHRGYTTRKSMIAVFVNEVGVTYAGASTYFNTCRNMYENGV